MNKKMIGTRVGAISHTDKDTVYIFGFGTYEGDEVPPVGTPGVFGADASEFGPNPKIKLDNGNIVWGCQCWWGPEAKVQKAVAQYPHAITVDLPKLHKSGKKLKKTEDDLG